VILLAWYMSFFKPGGMAEAGDSAARLTIYRFNAIELRSEHARK
jgi:hypothetical protein